MGVRDELCGRAVGDFVVREQIGQGGFGAVYRCEQPLLGREAVIKVLHDRLCASNATVQRFLREAPLASRLDHPYAAHIYGFGVEDDGLLWIAMEMVHGVPLDRWLRERGPLGHAELVPFFERIAEVVQTAHERGIIHRDLKPSNVMVIERAGRLLPKLLDFGLAKLLEDESSAVERTSHRHSIDVVRDDRVQARPPDGATLSVTPDSLRMGPPMQAELTKTGAVMGSPPYMAPEQWSAGAVGPRADLYALGVLAYEALSGRRPFQATTMTDWADLHTNQPVPAFDGEHAVTMDQFFARALAKHAVDRFATALELAAALRVASGIADEPVALPRLDRALRDAWVADAPQPIAEAVAAFDGARNPHHARDAARELLRSLVGYLLTLALAARAQVRDTHVDPAVDDLLRALHDRGLGDEERVRLIRFLVRPFADRRTAYPIPPLVELAVPSNDHEDVLELVRRLCTTSDPRGTADDLLRAQLAHLVPGLGYLLRAASFVLEYPLVVGRAGVAERWTGIRRAHRQLQPVSGGELIEYQPLLVDRHHQRALALWPLVQVAAPAPGAEDELFMFDGGGGQGARLVAMPTGLVRQDPTLWDWLAAHVLTFSLHDSFPTAEQRSPYLGLDTFSQVDADRFVGRERDVDCFTNLLRTKPLQVIAGASGAGKSSFVFAGIVPALPSGWRVITVHPGGQPIARMAAKLAIDGVSTTLLEEAPAAAASLVAAAAGDGAIVIVIDQLEELFTLCRDERVREQFGMVIDAFTSVPDGSIRVICTLRDDFLMRAATLATLAPRMASSVFVLGTPSRSELIRIIVEPARRAGYELSDADLAPEMVEAVSGRPGALALLSLTALRLWELRDRRFYQLSRRAYEAVGGVGGVLCQHAEATFAAMGAADQRLMRETFCHLVTADETRAQLATAVLRNAIGHERADAAVDRLVAVRLLTIAKHRDGVCVEIIHEALLTAWPRAQQWIHEDVDGTRIRDQLRSAARQWDDHGRPHGLLWRGEALADLERWRYRGDAQSLTAVETAFAATSVSHAARHRRVRRRLVITAFAVLAVDLTALTWLRERADDADRIARSNRLAREQNDQEQRRLALLRGDPSSALTYLDETSRLGVASASSRYVIARALDPLDAEIITAHHGARLKVSVFSPSRKRLLTTGEDGTARVWDATTGRELAQLTLAPETIDAVWSRDGGQIAAVDTNGHISIWRPATEALHHATYADTRLTYPRIQFSRDGRFLSVADPSQAPAIFDVEKREWVGRLADEAAFLEVERSPTTDPYVLARENGVCTIWKAGA